MNALKKKADNSSIYRARTGVVVVLSCCVTAPRHLSCMTLLPSELLSAADHPHSFLSPSFDNVVYLPYQSYQLLDS